MENRPIGVFDSGLGGLTVVKALKEILPNESILYFGDTARLPYGVKSRNLIIQYSMQIANFLIKNGHSMFQKFLKNISKGDKRVFIINGKVCGAISRVPKLGSILSNMSKGAIPRLANLTKNELKISNIISKKIKRDGIYFAGIDFIDGKLNGDINVTSPTGIKTYFDLSNVNLAETFWKGL